MTEYYANPQESVKKCNPPCTIYRALKPFITLGKILGFFHLYTDERGSSPSRAQKVVNVLHKVISISVPLVLCHVGLILYGIADDPSKNSARKLDKAITFVLSGANLVAVDITFSHCALFGHKLVSFIRQLATLDDVVNDKLPRKRFKLTQLLMIVFTLGFVFVYSCSVVIIAVGYNISDPLFIFSNIIFVYYGITSSCWLAYDTFFITFLLWLFGIAYFEIKDRLQRSLRSGNITRGLVILFARSQERKVYRMVCETQRIFALHIAVITLQTSFLVCAYLYDFVTEEEDYLSLFLAFGSFLPLLGLAIAADYLKSQYQNLITSLSDVDSDSDSSVIEQDQIELDLFRWKLISCSVDVNGYGFFTLSRSLITTILGSIATNIVILSQFRSDAQAESKSCPGNNSSNY